MPNKRTKNKALLEYEKNKKEQTKQKILEAIETLKKDFAKITITSISKVSGISREALYTYREVIDTNSTKTAKDLTVKEIEELIKENRRLKKIVAKFTNE